MNLNEVLSICSISVYVLEQERYKNPYIKSKINNEKLSLY